MTLSEENYLKAIYHICNHKEGGVSTNSIAEKMDTKASSVTDMIKKLSEKGLVDYKRYKGTALTQEGKLVASNIVRKHRLWEVFLLEKLNFTWDEVHDVAEQLEHIKSEKLTDQLDAFLGFPTRDPHGDPIPDKDGNIKTVTDTLLSTLQKDDRGIIVGVKDSSSSFLKYLDKQEIALGKKIKVLDTEPFDNSMKIKIKKQEIVISNQIASNIYIKKSN
ncbi:metal-dependent transcriptional regulator [Kordia sp. YSTF-M3]|uniref:Transcriptional regulator MntR n=1 Tax=Kordia aestuariivivens TaxID=2759037 RepID=A0ABR7Q6S8_9FLAO|nr:metal-dependent transcriptional regulator [Kordia aestuariivivens]MBC8754277.1 metal-dependent transcriptional regulator [Kordia aestuariivivens]